MARTGGNEASAAVRRPTLGTPWTHYGRGMSGNPKVSPVTARRGAPAQVFVAYSSQSRLREEALVTGFEQLQRAGALRPLLWTQLRHGGRFVIDTITDAIVDSQLSAFDVTDLNPNVLFELTYAIAADRKVWILRDSSVALKQREWSVLGVLSTLAYTAYVNSEDIVKGYYKDRPLESPTTIYRGAIANSLHIKASPSILYVPSLYETNADRLVFRRLNRETQRGIRIQLDDPSETGPRSLTWYAQEIHSADAVVVHFCSPSRAGAETHNARCAVAAGLAFGMNRPVFMLAEPDYETPIDYRDMMFQYHTPQAAAQELNDWLEVTLSQVRQSVEERQRIAGQRALQMELRALQLGDPVAENEQETLPDYFVETSAFRDLINHRDTLFVGRKGTGKTANLYAAAARLSDDKRNLVVVVKPYSYELSSIASLLQKFGPIGERGYLMESIWKYLIYSEVAIAEYERLRSRPVAPEPGSDERQFVDFMEERRTVVMDEFAVRLERVVNSLATVQPESADIASVRGAISQGLHNGILRDLRERLGFVLNRRPRVAILIDNLDKAWSPEQDHDAWSEFLLGLLSSVGRIEDEFGVHDRWRKAVRVTLAVLLRSDIFEYLRGVAREPDKLTVTRLTWQDPELLLSVIEERFAASRDHSVDGGELWSRYFCQAIDGVTPREYIARSVLPRPRDIVYYCRAAITAAVNAGRGLVTEADLRTADREYSQFALDALMVESVAAVTDLSSMWYEFYGAPEVLTVQSLYDVFRRSQVPEESWTGVCKQLVELSFLGVRIGEKVNYCFDVVADALTVRLTDRLLRGNLPEAVFVVHPAFHAYLEIGALD